MYLLCMYNKHARLSHLQIKGFLSIYTYVSLLKYFMECASKYVQQHIKM